MDPARVNSGQAGATGCQMGDVILLLQRKRTAAARISRGEGATAQIVFFTGVRYQRMSEAAPVELSGRGPRSEGGEGGKRKRKRG
jgi:hypothetical protein